MPLTVMYVDWNIYIEVQHIVTGTQQYVASYFIHLDKIHKKLVIEASGTVKKIIL